MIIEGFTDMSKIDIKAMYQKSENAFNVAVNRMLKETGDPSLKYKDEAGTICIKAAGVEWLHNYFQKPADLSTEPMIIQLEERIKALEKELQIEKAHKEEIKDTIKSAFEAQLQLIEENYKTKLQLSEKTAETAQNELKSENKLLKSQLEDKNNRINELENRSFWDYFRKK